jgi:hypothetical protein
MTIYVREPVRFAVKAFNAGAALSYSVAGLPAGAAINASTGRFSWQPAMNDTGTHTAVFTVSNGAEQAQMNVAMTVVMPALAAGEYIRLLRPNGGEVYAYGDSLNVAFVTIDCNNQAMVWFGWGTRPWYNSSRMALFTGRSDYWLHVDEDSTDARNVACRFYHSFSEQRVNVGFYRMALRDTLVGGKALNFGGDSIEIDSLYAHIENQYADGSFCRDPAQQSALLVGDWSNAPFSVAPGSTSAVARGVEQRPPRKTPLRLNNAGEYGHASVYTLQGQRIHGRSAGTISSISAGVYFVKMTDKTGIIVQRIPGP